MWKRDASPKPVSVPPNPTPQPAAQTTPTSASSALREVDARPADNLVMNLGKTVMIKGELSASEDLTLCGQMEGRVTLIDHTLTIGPQADIRAEINASTVVIMGAVSGNVTAGKKVEVRATGSVTGDIVSPRIVIVDGGQILGKVQMVGEKSPGAWRSA